MKRYLTGDRDYDLFILLRNATDIMVRTRHKELNELGVLGRQAALLFVVLMIEREGGVATPGEISRWLFREPHTISETLSRMEKEGLINKVNDLGKKSMVRVVITDKGKEYYTKSAKRRSAHRILSCLSKEERQLLWSSLEKVRDVGIRELTEIGVSSKVPWP